MPSLRLAYKIEKHTGGVITLYDWLPKDLINQIKEEVDDLPYLRQIRKKKARKIQEHFESERIISQGTLKFFNEFFERCDPTDALQILNDLKKNIEGELKK